MYRNTRPQAQSQDQNTHLQRHTRTKTLLNYALELHQKGFNIFPLNSQSDPITDQFQKREKGKSEQDILIAWCKIPHSGKSWTIFRDNPLTKQGIESRWKQNPNANIAIITEQFVIFDTDNANATAWGRENLKTPVRVKTGKGIHFYYRKNPAFELRNSADKIGLDVRAGGGYAVGPGSVHGSGNKYQWDDGVNFQSFEDIPMLDKETLTRVQAYATVNIQGQPGKPAKSNFNIDDLPGIGSRNDYFFRAAMQKLREGKTRDQLKTWCEKTNKKLDEPLTDGELEKVLASALKNHDENLQDIAVKQAQVIEELNKIHAVVPVSGKVPILMEAESTPGGLKTINLIPIEGFKTLYSNQFIETIKDGVSKQVSKGEFWLKSPDRRQYKGLCFDPSRDEVPGYFNLWQGFAVEPKEGTCEKYYDHIFDNVCQGNEILYDYVLDWMADCVQNPTNKPGIALGVRGGQGVGKNMFVDFFGDLFGCHYLEISTQGHLTGNFNAHLRDNLVLFADEAIWGGNKKDESQLKSMITSKKRMVEMKGFDAIQLPNHTHLLLASNEAWIAPMAKDDRRFCILDVGNKQANNRAYFKALIDEMANGGTSALLYDLLNRDLTETDLTKIPKTQAQLDIKILSLDSVSAWLLEFLKFDASWRDLDSENPVQVFRTADLYVKYTDYCKASSKRPEVLTNWSKKVWQVLPSMRKKQDRFRGIVWVFENIDEHRKEFEASMNSVDIDWLDGAEEQEENGDVASKVRTKVRLRRRKR